MSLSNASAFLLFLSICSADNFDSSLEMTAGSGADWSFCDFATSSRLSHDEKQNNDPVIKIRQILFIVANSIINSTVRHCPFRWDPSKFSSNLQQPNDHFFHYYSLWSLLYLSDVPLSNKFTHLVVPKRIWPIFLSYISKSSKIFFKAERLMMKKVEDGRGWFTSRGVQLCLPSKSLSLFAQPSLRHATS